MGLCTSFRAVKSNEVLCAGGRDAFSFTKKNLFFVLSSNDHGCPKYLKYIKYLIPQKIQYLILQVLDTLFFFLVLFYLFSLCQVLFSQKKRQVLDQVQKKSGYLIKYLTFFCENKYLTDSARG